jgi:hypothetical protein
VFLWALHNQPKQSFGLHTIMESNTMALAQIAIGAILLGAVLYGSITFLPMTKVTMSATGIVALLCIGVIINAVLHMCRVPQKIVVTEVPPLTSNEQQDAPEQSAPEEQQPVQEHPHQE